eukprot:6049544-Alexandrium_andersonii.AAC.1
MSASLVGSEMCIRDSPLGPVRRLAVPRAAAAGTGSRARKGSGQARSRGRRAAASGRSGRRGTRAGACLLYTSPSPRD